MKSGRIAWSRTLGAGALVLIGAGAAPAQVQYESAKLTASDAARQDYFGASVAISCDVAVIGAPGDDDRGSAYIFRRRGTDWIQEQKLLGFGGGVAVSGDTIMVTAPRANAVYAYGWNGHEWVFRQALTPGDAQPYFGISPQIDGDVAVFGQFPDSGQGGAVYVFRRHQDTWIQEQKLLSPEPGAEDNFGLSASVSGNVIVAGARFHDFGGGAYVFRWNGSSWIQEQRLTASDRSPVEDDHFGESVAVEGNTILVGAPTDGRPLDDSGAVYVYSYTPGAATPWVEVQKLASLNADPGLFGIVLAMHEDVALVGELAGAAGPASGTAYLYEATNPGFQLNRILLPSDAEALDGFGSSVSLSDAYAIVGAYFNDDACPEDPFCASGSAYIYVHQETDCNGNLIPDSCEPDCDANGIPDDCDIRDCSGDSTCTDCNGNGVPDGCEADCNANSIADECDIAECVGDPACADDNQNSVPDGCEIGACCDREPFGTCNDALLRERCDCPTCEWTELASCAEIECSHESIPAVGAWGLAVLSLLLLIAAKIRWRWGAGWTEPRSGGRS